MPSGFPDELSALNRAWHQWAVTRADARGRHRRCDGAQPIATGIAFLGRHWSPRSPSPEAAEADPRDGDGGRRGRARSTSPEPGDCVAAMLTWHPNSAVGRASTLETSAGPWHTIQCQVPVLSAHPRSRGAGSAAAGAAEVCITESFPLTETTDECYLVIVVRTTSSSTGWSLLFA